MTIYARAKPEDLCFRSVVAPIHLSLPHWLPKWEHQVDRRADRESVNAAIAELTREQPSAHWIQLFEDAGIPCGPIYAMDEVFDDQQVKHLQMTRPVELPGGLTKDLIRSPLSLDELTHDIHSAPPNLGEHTDEVLAEFGFSRDEVAALRAAGAI